jgi:hypothetical protein
MEVALGDNDDRLSPGREAIIANHRGHMAGEV